MYIVHCTFNASNIWIDLYNGPPSKGDQDILHIHHLSLNIPHHTPENIFCRAFVTGNWNALLFVPFLFVEMTLKGSKQGVIAMHWRRSFSAPYYWAISYCHLGLRTRSRFRTLILNNPKFYHCCISWSLPEVSFLFYKRSILVLTRSFFCWWSSQNQNHPQDTGRRQGWLGGGATTSE